MRRPCAWRASLLPATEVVDLKRQAQRLAEAVREAGAVALSMFKTPLKNWTKGEALSPVSDADIAVDVLLRELLTSNNESIAWLSEESVDDPARLERATSGSSILSTARAPISRACRTGRSPLLWSRTAGRSRPAFMRRSAMNSLLPSRA